MNACDFIHGIFCSQIWLAIISYLMSSIVVLWCRARASEIKYYGISSNTCEGCTILQPKKLEEYWTKQCHILNNHHLNSHQTHITKLRNIFSHGKIPTTKISVENDVAKNGGFLNGCKEQPQDDRSKVWDQASKPRKFWSQEMGVEPKIGGWNTPQKMDGINNGKPY